MEQMETFVMTKMKSTATLDKTIQRAKDRIPEGELLDQTMTKIMGIYHKATTSGKANETFANNKVVVNVTRRVRAMWCRWGLENVAYLETMAIAYLQPSIWVQIGPFVTKIDTGRLKCV